MNLKHAWTRLIGVALVATAGVAHASIIDARFSGTVSDQNNTTFAVGSTIAGTFVYDTAIRRYLSFNIGGQSVAPGYLSSASVTPDLYSAIYQAQVSPLAGGSTNSTFAVDLEGISPWPSNDAILVLLNAARLASNLDTALSTFGFFTGNPDGTGVRSLNAALAAIRVTAIPEPGSTALVLIGLTALGLRRARRARS